MSEPVECPECEGSGLVPDTGEGGDGLAYCPTCGGDGFIEEVA